MRPPDNVFHDRLQESYRRVRLFLPVLLEHIRFGSVPGGETVVEAWNHLRRQPHRNQPDGDVPPGIISKAWRRHVFPDAGSAKVGFRACLFCVLDQLRAALKRRDIFVTPGRRYADPRPGLLSGADWESPAPLFAARRVWDRVPCRFWWTWPMNWTGLTAP